jgi:tripartite-type tricarboxylate transporter receptor subunit TctC
VLARYDLMLFAHAGRGFGNLQGFLDHARRFPDRVNFASPGPAGPARLAFESLKELAGAGGTPVHFKGLGPALTALLGGELDAGFAQANQAVRGGVNAGRLVVLGTGGVRRSSRFPDVPAIAELLPGFEAASWVGMIGPPGMSPVVVERIASALRLSLDNADFRAQLGDQGGELVLAGPDAFSALIARDVARLGPVVRRLGIRAE